MIPPSQIFQSIYDWNRQAGLLYAYNDELESSFQIEEALEGFDLSYLCRKLLIDENSDPKTVSRTIISSTSRSQIPDVDRFDKHIDSIIYAFGSLFKLGLSPTQALEGIAVVMHANEAKLKCRHDSMGKLTKPDGFVGPEPELEKILDCRS